MASNVQTFRRLVAPEVAKVAAVCYRQRGTSIEFLLVNTDSGRWTFPKGTVEEHLGPRESAALEAIEEAGAMGRISEEHFCVYLHAKGSCRRDSDNELEVAAFLLHVQETVEPEEGHRNPTWFSAREAKLRLAHRRPVRYQRELTRVVDHAIDVLCSRRKVKLSRPSLSRRVSGRR
jgi:8-oxo-dGTP pyrophosphatase MutT (NUDIX family)